VIVLGCRTAQLWQNDQSLAGKLSYRASSNAAAKTIVPMPRPCACGNSAKIDELDTIRVDLADVPSNRPPVEFDDVVSRSWEALAIVLIHRAETGLATGIPCDVPRSA